MSRLSVSIGALFVLSLALYLSVWIKQEEEQQSTSNVNALVATYQAKNLTTKLYDEAGNLTHQVFARGMQHYDVLGFVSFEQPQYTLYPTGGEASWQLSAKEGTLYDNQMLQLENTVQIDSLQADEFVKSVQTEFIEVLLNEQTVKSDEDVVISGDAYTIKGNGFSGNLQQQHYELQNHVETIYSPVNP